MVTNTVDPPDNAIHEAPFDRRNELARHLCQQRGGKWDAPRHKRGHWLKQADAILARVDRGEIDLIYFGDLEDRVITGPKAPDALPWAVWAYFGALALLAGLAVAFAP